MRKDPSTFVLVHGAWHDGWCWHLVASALEKAGHQVSALDLPLTGSDDDVRAVEEALDLAESPVVLVGHSYGGRVISEAASGREEVAHLVFVCAFAMKASEESASEVASPPPTRLEGQMRIEGEQIFVETGDAREIFYGRCPSPLVSEAIRRLRPMSIHGFSERRPAAWESIRSTYVVCSEDQALHPLVQERMAERCTHTERLATDHSPFLSAPERLSEILLGTLEDES